MDFSNIAAADIAAAFITHNLLTFAAFGIDKMLAEAGRRRVRESTLLALALIGGTPGAYAGRHLFRHKTCKQPFSGRLHTIAGLQVLALGAAGGWMLGG